MSFLVYHTLMNKVSSQINDWLEPSEIRHGIIVLLNRYSARRKDTYVTNHNRKSADKQNFLSLLARSWYNKILAENQKNAILTLFWEIKKQESNHKKNRKEICAERKEILESLFNTSYYDQLPNRYKSKTNEALLWLYNAYKRIWDKQKTYIEVEERRKEFIEEELLREYLESEDCINYMRSNNWYSWVQHISSAIQEFLEETKTQNWTQLKIIFDATEPWNQSKN